MRATGVVRRIDDLGRIVIPKEIRRNLRIRDGESLEIFVDGSNIVLKKFSIILKYCSILLLSNWIKLWTEFLQRLCTTRHNILW